MALSMDASATPAATPPLVSLRNVGKRFANGTLALQGMTLDCGEHDFISFLGPSGCGKSTALRLIAGLTRASSGELNWSRENTSGSKSDRELGFVFQEPTLMPWTKVFDNVWLPLKLAGMRRDEAAPVVEQVLEMVGLSRFADVYPRELSGGMKMRVSIARALVTHPRLLLMDEPFAALDEITRQRLNDDVLRLWRETGITVIFVTHSVFESAFLSNRIVVMRARPGQVYADLPLVTSAVRDENYRTSEEYRATTDTVSRALQEAIQRGAQAQ